MCLKRFLFVTLATLVAAIICIPAAAHGHRWIGGALRFGAVTTTPVVSGGSPKSSIAEVNNAATKLGTSNAFCAIIFLLPLESLPGRSHGGRPIAGFVSYCARET